MVNIWIIYGEGIIYNYRLLLVIIYLPYVNHILAIYDTINNMEFSIYPLVNNHSY